jgi:hypothetical protein
MPATVGDGEQIDAIYGTARTALAVHSLARSCMRGRTVCSRASAGGKKFEKGRGVGEN